MTQTFNGRVYVDIPPIPNNSFVATAFPIVAPAANRAYAQGVIDFGILSIVHNATNGTAPGFTCYAWSDTFGNWYQIATLASLAAGVLGTFKVPPGSPFYVIANAALTGAGAVVVLGGMTIQGNKPIPTAGV